MGSAPQTASTSKYHYQHGELELTIDTSGASIEGAQAFPCWRERYSRLLTYLEGVSQNGQ